MAEDCVADTFSRFLKALRAGKGPDNHLQAYLYRIAHNLITDSYRRQAPVMVELDDSLQENYSQRMETLFDRSAESHRLRMALRTLTPDQRQVITLRFIEEWKIEEVAKSLQKPVGAIKALQHRALETLRKICTADEKVSNHGFQ